MVQKLNKPALLLLFVFTALAFSAQEDRPGDKDYKDREQFEQFTRRRKMVAAWQISQLKDGALVVRLKTNQKLIDALLKQGNTLLAEEKRIQLLAANRNTMRAYLDHYDFSKLYFIFSNSSDTLLKGARSNIFVDTTLMVNPSIVMTQTFYLIAERDDAYNSTIGFVKEDSARFVSEQGYSVKEMAVVVKNKYGHQLKRPFPYYEPDRAILKSEESYTIAVYNMGYPIPFLINKDGRLNSLRSPNNPGQEKAGIYFNYRDSSLSTFIPKALTYRRLSISISNFNANLHRYYRNSPHLNPNHPDPVIKPFLY